MEPKILVDEAYPELVQAFESSKKKTKAKGTKKKISEEPPAKKVRKEKKNNGEGSSKNSKKKQLGLDNFLKKAVLNSQKVNSSKTNVQEEVKTSTPMKTVARNSTFISDLSDFGDGDELDLSGIVLDIMANKPDYMQKSINKSNVEISLEDSLEDLANASSFFITNPVENDLFEHTFNMMYESDESEETDENDFIIGTDGKMQDVAAGSINNDDINKVADINEIVLDDPEVETNKTEAEVKASEDSFDIVCEPLLERIKRKIR